MLEVEQVLQVEELELVVLVVLVEVPELGVLASVLAEHCSMEQVHQRDNMVPDTKRRILPFDQHL